MGKGGGETKPKRLLYTALLSDEQKCCVHVCVFQVKGHEFGRSHAGDKNLFLRQLILSSQSFYSSCHVHVHYMHSVYNIMCFYINAVGLNSELAQLVKLIAEELHKKDHELILVIPATKKG